MSDDHESDDSSGSERTAEISEGLERATETLGKQVQGLIGGSSEAGSEDQTAEDTEHAFEAVSQSAGAVQQASNVANDVNHATDHFQEGENWAGSADYIDAGSASEGHLADALGSLGAMTNDRGIQDAARVMRGAQAVSQFAGTVVRQIGDLVEHSREAADEASRHVEYRLEIDGSSEHWHVHSVEVREALSEAYEAVVRVRCDNHDIDIVNDLLGREADLRVERRHDFDRRLCGIIGRVAEIGSRRHHVEIEIHVVPAFALLAQTRDSRIYQDKTAVEIVEEVLREGFGPYSRELDTSGLTGTYAPREMCVQYCESHRDFASRLLEEEGIGYYFDFDTGGGEKMVLFDANPQLQSIDTLDNGDSVPFSDGAQRVTGREPIVSFEAAHRLTATSVAVRDLDWTESQYRAEASRDGEDARGRTRSVYDHGHGRTVTLYDFRPGARYGANDADQQAQIRQELLVRDQNRFVGVSMLIGMRPGVMFNMQDHPVPGLDGRYLVMKVRHISAAPPHGGHEGHSSGEEYHNVFECISADQTTYEPDRDTPKPAIYGVQTAIVSGPAVGEPYTDEYGRIKVRFHWDRHAIDPSRASAWVRLAQTWAGHDSSGLHTFLFIPRVGSEVVVTFLDGDPDRPLVTGSVYNAQNLPPLSLPGEASRSVIRTESLGGGGGFNELSFEDASGQEEVYLHAQRNLRERVLNDHTTHVGHDQRDTVDHDQELTVHNDRTKTVDQNETVTIGKARGTEIGTDDTLHVKNNSSTTVDNNMTLDVLGNRSVHVLGAQDTTIDGGASMTITGGLRHTINSGGWQAQTTGFYGHYVTEDIAIQSHLSTTLTSDTTTMIQALQDVTIAGQNIVLQAGSKIKRWAPGGIVNLTPARDEHVASEHSESFMEVMENNHIKLEFAHLVAAFISMKIEYTGLKIELHGTRFENEDIRLAIEKLEARNASAARIARAACTLLG